jgi:hypothetical protein
MCSDVIGRLFFDVYIFLYHQRKETINGGRKIVAAGRFGENDGGGWRSDHPVQ